MQIGVAATFTAEPLEAFLGGSLLDAGVVPAFSFADYNQIHQVCFDPQAALGDVDYLVLLWRLEDLFGDSLVLASEGDADSSRSIIEGAAQLGAAVATAAASSSMSVIVSVPPVPQPVGVDLRDSIISLRLSRIQAAALDSFVQALAGATVTWADVSSWELMFGREHSHDVVRELVYKQPFATGFWRVIGSNLAEIVLRERRPPPKCIVLDCDNTLWGGVVGEDGIGGLQLGSAFPGVSYVSFQKVLKALRNRGILLAIASKNNPGEVDNVFTGHDEMVLHPDDIAVWRVNWGLKSDNLREIAAELNIGVDALVMIDDSDYELAEIANALPEVTLLQVPEETALLPDLIATSGLFRNMRVSDEDLARTEMIRQESGRKHAAEALSREEFLDTLELVLDYLEVGDEHVGRVAQLTNKTNQFNLTTIRRSEADIRALLVDNTHVVRAIRVSDKFGDYGLVGVAIAEAAEDSWQLDTLLMSCRVLGRGIETSFLAALAREASESGANRMVGRYLPTAKNGLVADLYPSHGFTEISPGEFVADLDAVTPAPSYVTLR